MKIYLDSCSLQRPLDNRRQIRIALEAEAILGIIGLCEAGGLALVSSEVLQFETEQIPLAVRREHASAILTKAVTSVELDDQIGRRAKHFTTLGIKPMDALHLASAEAAQYDFFCTCDDRFLSRAQRISDLKTKVASPLELVEELGI